MISELRGSKGSFMILYYILLLYCIMKYTLEFLYGDDNNSHINQEVTSNLAICCAVYLHNCMLFILYNLS